MSSAGEEYLAQAIMHCQEASEVLTDVGGLDELWRVNVMGRLDAVADLLRGVEGRFFLRSKLCLPFARRAAIEAERVAQSIDEIDVRAMEGMSTVDDALAALEQAARTLDERSTMQGMSIT